MVWKTMDEGENNWRVAVIPAVLLALCCGSPLLLAGLAAGGPITLGLLGVPTVVVAGAAILAGVAVIVGVRQRMIVSSGSTAAPKVAAPPEGHVEALSPRLHVQLLKTPGCASCHGLERSWGALRPRYEDLVHVEVVDLLEQPEVARRYGVLRSPAMVIEGTLRTQGGLDTAQLRRLLDEALKDHGATAQSAEALHD